MYNGTTKLQRFIEFNEITFFAKQDIIKSRLSKFSNYKIIFQPPTMRENFRPEEPFLNKEPCNTIKL